MCPPNCTLGFVGYVVRLDSCPYTHIMTHVVKTTMDIDNTLLVAAKETAIRRRTTLKAVVEHALRREIEPVGYARRDSECCYEVNGGGCLT
jgi:hypothetical protein